jgi:ATP-dependent DNA ligase
MSRSLGATDTKAKVALLAWVKTQLTRLVRETPNGDEWAPELKYNGYRIMPGSTAAMSGC